MVRGCEDAHSFLSLQVRQVFDLAMDAVDLVNDYGCPRFYSPNYKAATAEEPEQNVNDKPGREGYKPCSRQYKKNIVERNLLKVFAGLKERVLDGTAVPDRFLTGKWGAGAFGGDPLLAAMLQWVAASAAGMTEMVGLSGWRRVVAG